MIHDRGVVVVSTFSTLDRALVVLKRQVCAAGVFRELREREAYVPTGLRRRVKSRRARARERKRAAARLAAAQRRG